MKALPLLWSQRGKDLPLVPLDNASHCSSTLPASPPPGGSPELCQKCTRLLQQVWTPDLQTQPSQAWLPPLEKPNAHSQPQLTSVWWAPQKPRIWLPLFQKPLARATNKIGQLCWHAYISTFSGCYPWWFLMDSLHATTVLDFYHTNLDTLILGHSQAWTLMLEHSHTWTFSYLDTHTWTLSCLDTVMLGHCQAGTLSSLDTLMLGHSHTWTLAYLGTLILGHAHTWTLSYLDTVMLGPSHAWTLLDSQ